MDHKKLSDIFAILAAVMILLGVTGIILGLFLGFGGNIVLFWISLGGILPLSIISAIIALIFDFKYRKQKKQLNEKN